MAVEAQTALIKNGEPLSASEARQIYGLPVEFTGFKNLSRVRVDLSDPAHIKTLIPGFDYRPREYQADQAVCVLEDGQPIAALVQGRIFNTRWVHVISIANLSVEPEKVFLVGSETRPLENIDAYWPGYLIGHEKNLKLGLETISIQKRGDQFVISFPEGDAV